MGVALSLQTRFHQIAGAHLGAHPSLTFPTENQYNLVSLMGVALNLKTRFRENAGAHLGAHPSDVS